MHFSFCKFQRQRLYCAELETRSRGRQILGYCDNYCKILEQSLLKIMWKLLLNIGTVYKNVTIIVTVENNVTIFVTVDNNVKIIVIAVANYPSERLPTWKSQQVLVLTIARLDEIRCCWCFWDMDQLKQQMRNWNVLMLCRKTFFLESNLKHEIRSWGDANNVQSSIC